MWLEARHQRIQSMLERFDRLTTDQVATELAVSRETIRRDFMQLEGLGVLKRVHGGALRISPEAPIGKRASTRVKDKQAIARATAQHIDRALTVFMDAGSTTTLLARELAHVPDLIIITNSLSAALAFGEDAENFQAGGRVILLGGELSTRSPATAGSVTTAEIGRYKADIALLSPVAVDADSGATSFDHDEAAVAQAMVENARKVVLLADYSKIGLCSRVSYCPARKIDLLVTNRRATERPGFRELEGRVREVLLA